ncbi:MULTISPECIES: polysaccharide pyruvyl transferase family protein [Vibrio]|uniref:polysaccharide pyruvyl transferase family protein n=1 Tax=Vibrio TaxID=662 RepID=UPI001EEE7038|nr:MULTISPECIES: polysaccharide pyruvyl transferase family protein [Vibrio]MDW1959740.1 polysaccharide pyruvyl transferase family protein [Vibrio sp. 661]ULF96489.1 polysaccharide pyruvyl transferase family protein [Vibrio alginolyticus]
MELKMRNWGVVGYYGQGNYGDDLFCLIMSHLLSDDCKIINGNVRSERNINYFRPSIIYKHINKKNKIGLMSRVVSNLITPVLFKNVVFGGGSVFGKYASYKQRKILVDSANVFNSKLYAFGVSVGPFSSKDEENKYLKLLSKFDKVFVRDHSSIEVLESSEIKVNFIASQDMAFCLPKIIPHKDRVNGRLLLAIHNVLDYELIVNKIVDMRENFNEIIVLATEKIDFEFSKRVFSELKKHSDLLINVKFISYWEQNIEDVVSIISSSEYIVTTKLHGAITGIAYGRKVALFEYQEKCTELLVKVGFPREHLNYGDVFKFINNIDNLDLMNVDIDLSDLVYSHIRDLRNDYALS